MEEKNKILLKRLLIAVLIIVIISIVATIGIGNYFVNYAILRTGNGGDREVKNADINKITSILKCKFEKDDNIKFDLKKIINEAGVKVE